MGKLSQKMGKPLEIPGKTKDTGGEKMIKHPQNLGFYGPWEQHMENLHTEK